MEDIYNMHAFGGHCIQPLSYGVDAAEWCWSQTPSTSQLRKFFLDTFPQHWTRLTEYGEGRRKWSAFIKGHPDVGIFLLLALAGKDADREDLPDTKQLAEYLENPKA
jgi:hypothetical protein